MKKKSIHFIFSVVVGLLITVAVVGKLFFPSDRLRSFDYSVSIFELGLLCALIFFSRKWAMWLVLSLVFASWAGYAFFWMHVGQPCGCLGKIVEFPPMFSFAVDIGIWALSLIMSAYLGAKRNSVFLGIAGALIAGPCGYLMGRFVWLCTQH